MNTSCGGCSIGITPHECVQFLFGEQDVRRSNEQSASSSKPHIATEKTGLGAHGQRDVSHETNFRVGCRTRIDSCAHASLERGDPSMPSLPVLVCTMAMRGFCAPLGPDKYALGRDQWYSIVLDFYYNELVALVQ